MATTSQASKLESAQKSVHKRIERRRATALPCYINFKDFRYKFRRFRWNLRVYFRLLESIAEIKTIKKFLFCIIIIMFAHFQFSFLGKCCVASMSVNFRHFIMPLHEGRSVQYLHSSLFSLFAILSLRIKELPVLALLPCGEFNPENSLSITK